MTCVCGKGESTETCCGPILDGTKPAPTAEALMRARYAAYALGKVDFLFTSLHPDEAGSVDRKSTEAWSKSAKWNGLEIVETVDGKEGDKTGIVEFIARYSIKDQDMQHHERATFEKHSGQWRYKDGDEIRPPPVTREGPRVGRNDPCTCGSGKKYKKCCGKAA